MWASQTHFQGTGTDSYDARGNSLRSVSLTVQLGASDGRTKFESLQFWAAALANAGSRPSLAALHAYFSLGKQWSVWPFHIHSVMPQMMLVRTQKEQVVKV
ncbi:hypothetical protein E2320_006750, partial [Naja naja]